MAKLRKLKKLKAKTLTAKESPKAKSTELYDAAARLAAEGKNFQIKGLTHGEVSRLSKVWYAKYREQVDAGERESTMPANPKSGRCEECKALAGYYEAGVQVTINPLRYLGKLSWLCNSCAGVCTGLEPVNFGIRLKDTKGNTLTNKKALPKKALPKKRVNNARTRE